MPGSSYHAEESARGQNLTTPEPPSDGTCKVIIDGKLYDLTQWQHVHPGGSEILQPLNGKDATEPFHSLHSEEALKRLNNMGSKPAPEGHTVDSVNKNFRELRRKLREEGYFRRNPVKELIWNLFPFVAVVIGTLVARTHPIFASVLIGLGMQQAGWLGHDYVHGRGTYCWYMARLYGFINAFSARWWSNKHNTHHVYPNRWEYDLDIHNEPFLYLFLPNSNEDKPWRKYQHYYYLVVYSLLYASWRYQSLLTAISKRDWTELAPMAVNYFWLAFILPWQVSVASILIGGWCVAVVVTANHQVQELFYDETNTYDYIRDQFNGTCNVETPNPLVSWFFGGMQNQLEHHLFPTLPKYNHWPLRKEVEKFAADNGLPYHIMGVKEIMIANYEVVKRNASAPIPVVPPLAKVNLLDSNASLDSFPSPHSPGPDTPDLHRREEVKARQPYVSSE